MTITNESFDQVIKDWMDACLYNTVVMTDKLSVEMPQLLALSLLSGLLSGMANLQPPIALDKALGKTQSNSC